MYGETKSVHLETGSGGHETKSDDNDSIVSPDHA